MGKVLIVEDDDDLRFSLERLVVKAGYDCVAAATGKAGLDAASGQVVDCAFLDIGLPDVSGIELITRIKARSPDTDIVVVTGANDAKTAVRALREGALEYILKPFDLVEIRNLLRTIMSARQAVTASIVSGRDEDDGLVGCCRQMTKLKTDIRATADARPPVLIEGETGSGKEVVARALYNSRKEKRGLFVKVDCGTLASNIIASELFGHEQGAFTDAKTAKRGLVELADGGMLFLDEIGNLSLDLQPMLLRLIEESCFRRVGGLKDIHVDLRIVAATNLNLIQEVKNGRFREDLYYRLKVISLILPELRDRGDDILLLARSFLARFCREARKTIRGFTPDAEQVLLAHGWPGNVRELRNCIERAVIYAQGGLITAADLQLGTSRTLRQGEIDALVSLAEAERRHIERVLAATGGNKARAARILGISRSTLREKLNSAGF